MGSLDPNVLMTHKTGFDMELLYVGLNTSVFDCMQNFAPKERTYVSMG